ncbi:MAG: protease inhibitor I42 family protein [Oscillospiraceae bacterium]|nr:protease inhibitor I42 family protein [Oscillospiraceae bacterium]
MNAKLFSGIIAVLLVISTLISACGDAPAPQSVTLQFDANPTTGYSWEVQQSEELFDVASEYSENAHEEDMTGVGGTETFVLTPKAAGTTEVTFSYVRSWEDTEPETQVVYTFKVDRKLQVTMESAVGLSPDFPIETPSPEIG